MLKLLIVEDEKLLTEVLVDRFKKEGYEIRTASDGLEGLDSALKNHPDIMLLDLIIPKIDGIEVLKKLRDDPWGKNLPVIILTNVNDDSKVDEAKRLGAKAFMVKTDWGLEGIVEIVRMNI